MYNKTAWNVLGILEYFRDLDESIYSSFLFNFFHDYKNNYIDDFNSRRAHDLTKSLGHFEGCFPFIFKCNPFAKFTL